MKLTVREKTYELQDARFDGKNWVIDNPKDSEVKLLLNLYYNTHNRGMYDGYHFTLEAGGQVYEGCALTNVQAQSTSNAIQSVIFAFTHKPLEGRSKFAQMVAGHYLPDEFADLLAK